MAQDNFDDEFESVAGPKDVWNPTKDKEGDSRTEATPDDYLIGYYIDKKEGVGQNDSTVFTVERKSDGKRLSVWGTRILVDEMDKVRIGSLVKITWLGKKLTKAGALKPEKKRTSTDSYHAWEVGVSKNDTSRIGGAAQNVTPPPAKAKEATASNQVAPPAEEEELPF